MTIEPGQSIAFVGASGCGKSTMISLLKPLYDPISGRICVGGSDLSKISPRLYRQQMSLAMQQPILFNGSIRDNIALALEYDVSDEDTLVARRQANASTSIQLLPEGSQHPLRLTGGCSFPTAKRQRIAISRALSRKPWVLLLLDEATPAPDTQSEQLVQGEAAAARTRISVAHSFIYYPQRRFYSRCLCGW